MLHRSAYPFCSIGHTQNAVSEAMASNNNSKKLLVRNGSIGYLKGETFHPESNFFYLSSYLLRPSWRPPGISCQNQGGESIGRKVCDFLFFTLLGNGALFNIKLSGENWRKFKHFCFTETHGIRSSYI